MKPSKRNRPLMINFSFQLTKDEADRFKYLAEGSNKSPAALAKEVVTALLQGDVKLPSPPTLNDIYTKK